MILNPDVNVDRKPEISGKHSENRKKNKSLCTENQKYIKYRNISYVGARFFYFTWQEGGSQIAPLRPVSYVTEGLG